MVYLVTEKLFQGMNVRYKHDSMTVKENDDNEDCDDNISFHLLMC
jgi:hypothetical protein